MNALYLVFGALFGFILSRARATDYDTIVNLFRLVDFHIAGVMAVAIAVAAAGLYLLRQSHAAALIGCPIEIRHKPSHRWILPAGLVFGTGWALTGT